MLVFHFRLKFKKSALSKNACVFLEDIDTDKVLGPCCQIKHALKT